MACRGSGVRIPSAPPKIRTKRPGAVGSGSVTLAEWHAGGQGFESPQLHRNTSSKTMSESSHEDEGMVFLFAEHVFLCSGSLGRVTLVVPVSSGIWLPCGHGAT